MKNYILLGMAMLLANLSSAQRDRSSAEVFIQIQDRGNFTVYLDDESVGSAKGRFRFYDVYSTSVHLAIVENNKRIFDRQLTVRPNERLILSFSQRSGLRTINSLPMYRNGKYILDNFDGQIGDYNTGIVPPRQSNFDFDQLNALVKQTAFDEDKLKLFQLYGRTVEVTVDQASILLRHFLKDENRLAAFKALQGSIVDFQNVYQLKDSFTFSAGKEEFMATIKTNIGSRRPIGRGDYDQLLASVKKEAFDDGKTQVVQAAVQFGSLTTAQIADLLKTYSFEDRALSLAKLLYGKVSDPQRYFTLKEIFKYRSNQEAFIDFLGRQ